jgi:hypothetical protein
LSAVEKAASTAMEGSASEQSDYGSEWSVLMADIENATETALMPEVGVVLRNVAYAVPVETLAELASYSNGGDVDIRGCAFMVYMSPVEPLAAPALSGTDSRLSAEARRAPLWDNTLLANMCMILLSQHVTMDL